jgi:hypothetical protein
VADSKSKRKPIDDSLDGKVVRYIGTSNIREIKESEWRTALGRDHATITWYRDPPLCDVPVSRLDLDQAEFARCILSDRDFRLIDLAVERAASQS